MGYKIYYNPNTKTWSIYSTIISDCLYSDLKSPEEVASKIIKGSWFVSVNSGNWVTFVTEEEAKVFQDWVEEALEVQREKREYVGTLGVIKVFCEDCKKFLGELEDFELVSDDPYIPGGIVCKLCAEKREKEQKERFEKLSKEWGPKVKEK